MVLAGHGWMRQVRKFSCHSRTCRLRRQADALVGLRVVHSDRKNSGRADMAVTRRDFLASSAAVAALSGFGRATWAAPLPREADIVVIGAGTAGIAAARRIQAANRKVIVVEADQ